LLLVVISLVVEVGVWGVSAVESVESVEDSVVSVEVVVEVLRVRFSLALENMVVHVVMWVGRISSSIVCVRISRINPGAVCTRVGRINPGIVKWISLVIGAIDKCGVRFCFRFSFCFTFVEMMRIWVSVVNSGGMSICVRAVNPGVVCARVGINPSIVKWISLVVGTIEKCGVRFCFTFVEMMNIVAHWVSVVNSGGMRICVRAVNSGVMDIVDIWTIHMCLFSILMSLQAKVMVFGSSNRYRVTRRSLQMGSYIPVVRNPLWVSLRLSSSNCYKSKQCDQFKHF